MFLSKKKNANMSKNLLDWYFVNIEWIAANQQKSQSSEDAICHIALTSSLVFISLLRGAMKSRNLSSG